MKTLDSTVVTDTSSSVGVSDSAVETNSTGGVIKDVIQDDFQDRYLKHQQMNKKQELIKLMKERHSRRRYADDGVEPETINEILEACRYAPSSCDRFGVRLKVITDRDDKAILNGLLVGGVGWIYRAPVVILLLASTDAYKAGDEIKFMPYLDAGVLIQQMSLMATSMGLHAAYANPNIREKNMQHFKNLFKPDGWTDVIPCGALAIGYPHPEQHEYERNLIGTLEI